MAMAVAVALAVVDAVAAVVGSVASGGGCGGDIECSSGEVGGIRDGGCSQIVPQNCVENL